MKSLHRRTLSANLTKTNHLNLKHEASQFKIRVANNRSRTVKKEFSVSQHDLVPISKAFPESLLSRENQSMTQECLENHTIIQEFRAKMVDWMVEVTVSYKCSPNVFFLAVKLMDKYFKVQQNTISSKSLHLIGLTCMFISSKFTNTRTKMRLIVVRNNIGHKKFSLADIKSTEKMICTKLEFDLSLVTSFDFLESFYEELEVPDVIKSIAELILRMSQFYYSHLEFRPSLVALSALIIAAKSTRQEKFAEKALGIRSKDKELIISIVEKITLDIDSYIYKFPDYTSIMDFCECSLVNKRPGPLFTFKQTDLENEQARLRANPNSV